MFCNLPSLRLPLFANHLPTTTSSFRFKIQLYIQCIHIYIYIYTYNYIYTHTHTYNSSVEVATGDNSTGGGGVSRRRVLTGASRSPPAVGNGYSSFASGGPSPLEARQPEPSAQSHRAAVLGGGREGASPHEVERAKRGKGARSWIGLQSALCRGHPTQMFSNASLAPIARHNFALKKIAGHEPSD